MDQVRLFRAIGLVPTPHRESGRMQESQLTIRCIMNTNDCNMDWAEQWRQLQRSYIDLHHARSRLVTQIDDFIQGNPDPELVRQGLTMRGELKGGAGDLKGEKEDYLLAHNSSTPHSFGRYILESCCLTGACERLGDAKESLAWLFRSLETCMGDPATSCGTALSQILERTGYDEVAEEERCLVIGALEHSWRVLSLEGEPDLDCLESSIDTVVAAETVPHSKDSPE